MSSTEKITHDQVEKNFEQAFKKVLKSPEYEEGLHKVLETFDCGECLPATASFKVNTDNVTFSVNVDVKNENHEFMGKSAQVSNPQGGVANGNLHIHDPNLYADTSKFEWFEGSILAIYFRNESGDFLGFFSVPKIPELNPVEGHGTGSWQ